MGGRLEEIVGEGGDAVGCLGGVGAGGAIIAGRDGLGGATQRVEDLQRDVAPRIGEADLVRGVLIFGGRDHVLGGVNARKHAGGRIVAEVAVHVADGGDDAAQRIKVDAGGVAKGIAGEHRASGPVVLIGQVAAVLAPGRFQQARGVIDVGTGATVGRLHGKDAPGRTAGDGGVEVGSVIADAGCESIGIELNVFDKICHPFRIVGTRNGLTGGLGDRAGGGAILVCEIHFGECVSRGG